MVREKAFSRERLWTELTLVGENPRVGGSLVDQLVRLGRKFLITN